MKENTVIEKSKKFAVRIIRLYKFFKKEKREFDLLKQLLRSATSIGANACEADVAQSRKEFVSKLNISLKEANESLYWLDVFYESEIMFYEEYKSLHDDCNEIRALLISIIKSTNNKM